MRTGSLWLFQMQEVDDYYTGGGNGGVSAARAAIDLYPIVLRDPQPADWLTDPMESLAALVRAARPDLRALVRSGRRPQGPRTGHRSGRPCPAASLPLHLAAGRAVGIAALGAGGTEGIAAPAGPLAAAGIVEPLPRLQGPARSGRRLAAGVGRRAAGAGRRGEDQEAGPGHGPAHGRSAASRKSSCARWPCAAIRRRSPFHP